MRPSPLTAVLESLLVQHHTSLRALAGDISKLGSGAHAEKLAMCIEGYLDRANDQLHDCERLLTQRRLKLQSTRDRVLESLVIEAAAAQELEFPPELLDVLLARAFLRIQHSQIAALGVLQALATEHGDREILTFSRGALAAEIEAEEALAALVEDELVSEAVASNA